jgi:hypothetical protein
VPRPPSNANIPVAPANAVAPERRRKRRTGVKMPAPAAEPIPHAMPAPPHKPATDPVSPVLAAPADQFDVELVDAPILTPLAPPPRKGFRPTLRDALMVIVGIFLALVAGGIWWSVVAIRAWLKA